MIRASVLGLSLLILLGCRLPDERVLRPLPEDQILLYDDLLARARTLAQIATEAFYADNWIDLEDAAQGLVQTARFMPRSSAPPVAFKDRLPQEAGQLGKEAIRLRDGARAKNVALANEALQRIHLRIRALRLEK